MLMRNGLLFSFAILFTKANEALCDDSISFLAIGDWGGNDTYPYYQPGQIKTAAGMDRVASEIDSKFVVALGDNFYPKGIAKVTSQRFESTFQSVYNYSTLMTPWYVIGGNHDHLGNITAQIEYTRNESNIDNRWQFPSLYHSHSFLSSESAVLVDLILIDTVDLAGSNKAQHPDEPGYFDPLPLLSKSQAAGNGKQWRWIEEKLASSKADYLLVGGHYPLYSVCKHGPTETLIHHLRPLLQKYGAHYMSGHDHCMVHQQEDNIHHILTGMGDECCYKADNFNNNLNPIGGLKWFLSSEVKDLYQAEGGFTSFVATKNDMVVKYHDQDGNVVFTADSIPPRAQSCEAPCD